MVRARAASTAPQASARLPAGDVRAFWWHAGPGDPMQVMGIWPTANGRSRLLGGAAVVLLVLSAAACGGGGGDTTTSTASGGASAVQWANSVCSSFTTWKTSLESVKTEVTAQPSKS